MSWSNSHAVIDNTYNHRKPCMNVMKWINELGHLRAVFLRDSDLAMPMAGYRWPRDLKALRLLSTHRHRMFRWLVLHLQLRRELKLSGRSTGFHNLVYRPSNRRWT